MSEHLWLFEAIIDEQYSLGGEALIPAETEEEAHEYLKTEMQGMVTIEWWYGAKQFRGAEDYETFYVKNIEITYLERLD